MCHSSWDVRRKTYDATKKIVAAAPQLSEVLLLEFTDFLSLVGEKISTLKIRYKMTVFNFWCF